MQSYHIETFGTVDGVVLRCGPDPDPGPREVVIRVRATSLNYRDLQILLGISPYLTSVGVVPLADAAGEVVAIGTDVTRARVGTHVCTTYYPRWIEGPLTVAGLDLEHSIGASVDGVLSEYVVRHEDAVVVAPDHLTFEEAATLPCAGVTAWTALNGASPVGPGDTVLVQGSGGVSVFALQLAIIRGADVLAITSTGAKAARFETLGARACVNYTTTPDWHLAIRELTGGRGVDCVIEVGGAATLTSSLQALAVAGRLVIVGQLEREGKIDIRHLRVPGGIIEAPTVGSRSAFENMNDAIGAHGVRPVIDRVFEFAEARDAYRYFAERRSHFGKIVISV